MLLKLISRNSLRGNIQLLICQTPWNHMLIWLLPNKTLTIRTIKKKKATTTHATHFNKATYNMSVSRSKKVFQEWSTSDDIVFKAVLAITWGWGSRKFFLPSWGKWVVLDNNSQFCASLKLSTLVWDPRPKRNKNLWYAEKIPLHLP